MKRHRIIWSSKATGTDETFFLGTLREARTAARKMIGEPVFFEENQIGVVEWAHVADENGNPK